MKVDLNLLIGETIEVVQRLVKQEALNINRTSTARLRILIVSANRLRAKEYPWATFPNRALSVFRVGECQSANESD